MADPSDDIIATLARYRAAKSPDTDETASAWGRMQTRLATHPTPMSMAPTTRPRSVRWGVPALAVAAVLAVAVSLDIGGVLQLRSETTRQEIEAPYTDERDSAGGVATQAKRAAARRRSEATPSASEFAADAAPPVEATPEPPSQAPIAVVPDAAPTPAPTRRRTKGRRPTAPAPPVPTTEPEVAPDATIAAELALLRAAQKAIAGGNPARALTKLRQHASTFPNSMMEQERELARVRALCALGKSSAATKAAQAFRRKFSGSHLLPRLNTTCVGEGG